MAKNSIFELNGKAYDARSGALLGDTARLPHTANIQAMPLRKAPTYGGSMDGMIAGPQPRLHTPKHTSAHRPQPTKTLMRRAVTPPQPGKLSLSKSSASGLQPQSALQPKAPMNVAVTPKLSSAHIDPLRAHRARIAGRSQAVNHFRPAHHQSAPVVQAAEHPAPISHQPSQHQRLETPSQSQVASYDQQLEQDLFE